MDKRVARVLMVYGGYLVLAGVAGFLSNPEKAKTALMSGGLFGALSFLWGWLGLRKVSWSFVAAKVCAFFLAAVFTWRSIVTWGKVFDGAAEKTFAAVLITSMLVASVMVIIALFRCREK